MPRDQFLQRSWFLFSELLLQHLETVTPRFFFIKLHLFSARRTVHNSILKFLLVKSEEKKVCFFFFFLPFVQCLNIWQLRLSAFSEHCGIYFQAHFPLGWYMHVYVCVVSGIVYLMEELLAHTHKHTVLQCLSKALVSMSYMMTW